MKKIIFHKYMDTPWRRLGNKLFMFSSMLAIAKHKGYTVYLPKNGTHIREIFDLNGDWLSPDLDNHDVQKVSFECDGLSYRFNRQAIDSITHNTVEIDDGYLQSWKYYRNLSSDLETTIKTNLKFRSEIEHRSSGIYADYKRAGEGLETVAVHIRRTDFVGRNFDVCDLGYYKSAAERMSLGKTIAYIVFTDDIPYCKSTLPRIFPKNSPIIYDVQDEKHALCTMTKCDSHIISNSTFAWWGAYLSRSNRTICPTMVFTPMLKDADGNMHDDDFYLPEWERCPNRDQ